MNYAFTSFSTPEMSISEMLETAQKLGYAAADIRTAANHAHGIELDLDADGRRFAKKRFSDSGIAISCLSLSSKLANPSTAHDERTITKRYVDLAADLGCPRIRVFGGSIPDGTTRDEATRTYVTSLEELAPYAWERGVSVCLETHDDWSRPDVIASIIETAINCALPANTRSDISPISSSPSPAFWASTPKARPIGT